MQQFLFSKQVFPYFLLAAVILILSIVFFGDNAYTERIQQLTKEGYITSAQILKIENGTRGRHMLPSPDILTVRYAANGKTSISTVAVKMGVFYPEPYYLIGQHISLVYDPTNPDLMDFPNYDEPHPLIYSVLFFSALLSGSVMVAKLIARWNSTEV